MRGRLVLAFLLAGVVLALPAPGSAARAGDSPVEVVKKVTEWLASNKYGKAYDLMPPVQQQAVPYRDFARCWLMAKVLAEAFGVDISTLKVESARVMPKTRLMTLSGTKATMQVTVVKVTSSMEMGGKRASSTDEEFVVKIDGKWRYVWSDGLGSMKKSDCGIGTKP